MCKSQTWTKISLFYLCPSVMKMFDLPDILFLYIKYLIGLEISMSPHHPHCHLGLISKAIFTHYKISSTLLKHVCVQEWSFVPFILDPRKPFLFHMQSNVNNCTGLLLEVIKLSFCSWRESTIGYLERCVLGYLFPLCSVWWCLHTWHMTKAKNASSVYERTASEETRFMYPLLNGNQGTKKLSCTFTYVRVDKNWKMK